MDGISDKLNRQCGVISRLQVLASGGDDHLIARMVRRREWVRVHPGVYVDHTGPLTWHQRAWAAVLYAAPGALAGASALRAHGLRSHDTDDVIHVVVAHDRRLEGRPGLRVERSRHFERAVQGNLSPPRVRVEHAPVRVASAASTDDASVGVLACAHGLPRARRQQPEQTPSGAVHRDVEYVEQALLVELDGRLGHDLALDRWKDLERDFVAATTGRLTLRAGWGQVLQPCRLAALLAQILTARGWTGTARACGPGCSLI